MGDLNSAMPDAELKTTLDDWLTKLRSGKYKQTHNTLVEDFRGPGECMCCLGVLCDLLQERNIGSWSASGLFEFDHGGDSEESDDTLPESLANFMFVGSTQELELAVDIELLMTRDKKLCEQLSLQCAFDDGHCIYATALNDDYRLTFEEIATVVECSTHLNERSNPVYRPEEPQTDDDT